MKSLSELKKKVNKAYIRLANCNDYEKKKSLFIQYRELMDLYAERKQWVLLLES